MARTTISLPDELKREMDKIGGDANWSALAADTFLAEINRIKARKAALKGKPMEAAINRLRQSKVEFLGAAQERGKADGTRWAMETADYGELKRLADNWPQCETTETTDALGAPGVFLNLISEDDERCDRMDIDDFWVNLGKESRDEDAYSAQYWDGFVEGALEVFEKVDD
jgi:hypothetical protein